MSLPHYAYRVDHDLGFAPHISKSICTVCGCKSTTVERWAKKGSWVIGFGGANTGRKDTLIYAMQVDDTPPYTLFKKTHPRLAGYLSRKDITPDAPVLVSRTFYYFGDRSPDIPCKLQHIIHPTQGCKRLSDQDIAQLKKLVLRKYSIGMHGKPNNVSAKCKTCNPKCRTSKANKALNLPTSNPHFTRLLNTED